MVPIADQKELACIKDLAQHIEQLFKQHGQVSHSL